MIRRSSTARQLALLPYCMVRRCRQLATVCTMYNGVPSPVLCQRCHDYFLSLPSEGAMKRGTPWPVKPRIRRGRRSRRALV